MIVFGAVLGAHLIKFGLFLPEGHVEFVLNLKHFAFFLLLQRALVVLDLGPVLLAKLLQSAIDVLLRVLLYLANVRFELLEDTFSFIQLVILDFALLLADLDFLVESGRQMGQALLLLLLHFEFVLIELVHNAAFELLCLELKVFLNELFLLKQSEFFGFL